MGVALRVPNSNILIIFYMKKLVTGGIMDILLNNDERIDDLQINNLKIIQNITKS